MDATFIAFVNRAPAEERGALEELAATDGLESLADFAYRFVSEPEAAARGVKRAWAAARARAGSCAASIGAVARAAQRPAPVRPAPQPAPAPLGEPATAGARNCPRSRAKRQTAEEEDRRARRDAAAEVARLTAAWRVDLDDRQRGLAASADGPVARRLAHFETASLRGALRAWGSWCAWAEARALDPCAAAACPLTVDEFVLGHRSARTSARAVWGRLRWLRDHASAPFRLEAPPPAEDPETGAGPPPPKQAVVLEPEMLFWAEDRLRQCTETAGRMRLANAAVIAMAFGCVRYQHLLRSRPLERCKCAVWFRCFRGKQGAPGARGAFDWALPAGAAADLLWREWHAMADRRAAGGESPSSGLVFDAQTGAPVRLGLFNAWLKRDLAAALASAEERNLLTSYSLRRFMPTLASAAKIRWEDRVIGGNWTQPGERAKNRMPIRYNGQRREVEMAVRLFTRDVLQLAREHAQGPLRWEHFRAWASHGAGKQACRDLSAKAARDIAAASAWTRARHLPPGIVEELRRRRFRHLQRAPARARPAPASDASAAGAQPQQERPSPEAVERAVSETPPRPAAARGAAGSGQRIFFLPRGSGKPPRVAHQAAILVCATRHASWPAQARSFSRPGECKAPNVARR